MLNRVIGSDNEQVVYDTKKILCRNKEFLNTIKDKKVVMHADPAEIKNWIAVLITPEDVYHVFNNDNSQIEFEQVPWWL